MSLDPSVEVVHTGKFVKETVARILASGREAVAQRGLFRFALAGGNTPKAVYSALASEPNLLPWERVQVTFGDERCVPPEDAASNYRMAREALLGRVALREDNVFRIRGEIDPETAAREYEERLQAVASRFGESRYVHDVLLLGMGEDGHTASLFPGSPALDESVRSVVPATGPKPPPQRVSFTFPLINAARLVIFLVNDPGKQPVVDAALKGEYPSGRVRPSAGRVVWILGDGSV
jgi:6-phosphogluconolactonase